jgi:hypothetical protein
MATPDPNLTTVDVLDALRDSGYPLHEWGEAVDGAPMLAARAGGDRQPAIFITAGVHSTETAGVHAALNLLRTLDTDHEVHVLPLRDPFGFAGARHCLSVAAGQPVDVSSHEAARVYLERHGRLLRREGDVSLFTLGEYGFIWGPPKPGLDAFWDMYSQVAGKWLREEPQSFRPLWGKRVMLIMDLIDVEDAGALQRCWHAVMSERGEWLHLNRFFGRADAPPEVASLERLMQAVRPGLTCDLHEGNGTGFWMPIPRLAGKESLIIDMTRAYFAYVKARGYPILSYEEWLETDESGAGCDWMKPEPQVPGMFWCETPLRGEGPNLSDYAGQFGIGYGTESPMVKPLAMRVDAITEGIRAAIAVWEQSV